MTENIHLQHHHTFIKPWGEQSVHFFSCKQFLLSFFILFLKVVCIYSVYILNLLCYVKTVSLTKQLPLHAIIIALYTLRNLHKLRFYILWPCLFNGSVILCSCCFTMQFHFIHVYLLILQKLFSSSYEQVIYNHICWFILDAVPLFSTFINANCAPQLHSSCHSNIILVGQREPDSWHSRS